jgi:ribonuclease HI
MHHVQDVPHAEAEACPEAVLFAQRWGMTNIQTETDSQQLLQAIQDLVLNGALFRPDYASVLVASIRIQRLMW